MFLWCSAYKRLTVCVCWVNGLRLNPRVVLKKKKKVVAEKLVQLVKCWLYNHEFKPRTHIF